jgi:hypothetical protein
MHWISTELTELSLKGFKSDWCLSVGVQSSEEVLMAYISIRSLQNGLLDTVDNREKGGNTRLIIH